jgi:cytochrome oxidase Cu insertion factor (SCO1/SenC/PrrC family)
LADTRGRVVLITFIYTSCTDVCSFVAVKMRRAYELLGEDAKDAALVAVTTDPARDTIEVIDRYSRALGMYDNWSFLTGGEEELRQVWSHWMVGVQEEEEHAHGEESEEAHHHAAIGTELAPSRGLSADEIHLAGQLMAAFGGGYEVAHTAPFWILDRKGMVRALLDAEALPQDIVRDVRLLLRE